MARRLAAIMFTDMVGSTAAAQANEAEALKLRDEQADVVRPLFAAHQGREIKSLGDGFLAEFDSALHAVQCAVDIQQHLHERNAQPGVVPILLRIGVHLGDVERRKSDIFGDAVNIASRIQPLASPGGVCVSGEVFSQIRNKIPNKLERIPQAGLKGVQVSIEIYRVILPWTNPDVLSEIAGPTGIAVLPFTNISPDPKDEYFADGLTEELITVLSQLRELRVISRTSVMLYKATPKSASQIGVELGVASILEGSVRKAGSRLRVTAQLIDARSDRHLWAKTYDRELDDVFSVQAELALQVAEALKIELRGSEAARIESRPRVLPDSYLAYLKGRTLLHRDTSRATLDAARERFETAISRDPRNAAAYSGLADTIIRLGWWHRDVPPEESDRTARRLVDRAIELDPNLAEAHASLGAVLWREDVAVAKKEVELALSLNPSYSAAHNTLGNMLQDLNQPEEALVELALAEEADPYWSLNLFHMANLLLWLGRFDEALVKIQRAGTLIPDESSARAAYHGQLAEYYLARSDLPQVLKEVQRAEEADSDPRDNQLRRAMYCACVGDGEQSRAILRNDETLPDRPPSAQFIARIYAELGDLDNCFRWLARAEVTSNLSLQRWRLDPRLDRVRKDPRFVELLRKRKLA